MSSALWCVSKGLRERTSCHRLHHRRLDLEESPGNQELTDRRHYATPYFEDLSRIRIDDEIEVALSIAGLDVLQAMPLFRQGQETLRKKAQRRHMDTELVRLRPEEPSFDPDPVTEVEQLEDAEVEFRD